MPNALSALLADSLITLPIGAAIALAGAIVGFAVAWGAQKATIREMASNLARLELAVTTLTATCQDLATRVTVMERLDAERTSGARPRLDTR